MVFCKILIGPIDAGAGPQWPPQIIQLSEADASALAQYSFVEILASQPPVEPPVEAVYEGVALITNLNTASPEALALVRYIGPVTAQKLIDLRPYASLEEARVASGLAEAKWAEIEALLEI